MQRDVVRKDFVEGGGLGFEGFSIVSGRIFGLFMTRLD